MLKSKHERACYEEIQKKLFYLIPEKWDSVFLYASVVDGGRKKVNGEMYFYYFPKGLIKKKVVNAYEIPSLFNIDEDKYYELINSLYNSIKKLRNLFIKKQAKVWSNVTISIENFKFKAEYDYEDLVNSRYDSYERHIIWRYNYLHTDPSLYGKREKEIINRYIYDIEVNGMPRKDVYTEGIYDEPVHNIVDYERQMSVDEAIARKNKEERMREKELEKAKQLKKKKSKSKSVVEEEEDYEVYANNQILFGGYKKP